jgi:hypothetical protein
MFEVITCTINTGRVVRKLFDTRADADRHVTRWEEGLSRLKRNRRNYRVEIQYRELPAVKPVQRPRPTPEAA